MFVVKVFGTIFATLFNNGVGGEGLRHREYMPFYYSHQVPLQATGPLGQFEEVNTQLNCSWT